MEQTRFLLPVSAWYLLPCLLAGVVYAYLLYSKKAPWSKNLNYTLAFLRFVVVSFLAFLLLNPLIKTSLSLIEKPWVVLAIDNSESVAATTRPDSLAHLQQKLQHLADQLKADGINVAVQTLDGQHNSQLDSIKFNQKSTDLNQMLSGLQSTYENRNLANVVLVSDGISNAGVSPTYQAYNYKVLSVGLGDTVPKIDVTLRALYFNKIAYLGNKFPLKVEIQQSGYTGQKTDVLLKQNGKILDKKSVTFKNGFVEADFLVTANAKGLQHLVIEVVPLKGEFSTKNNAAHAYIDVIDGKEKILIAAAAPHPDIKAVRSAIEQQANYEIVTYIQGIDQLKEGERYDLVILHQLPDQRGSLPTALQQWINDGTTPVWFMLGTNSNVQMVNSLNNILKIDARVGQTDKVTASYNKTFDKFIFEEERQFVFPKLPPMTVPYGDYTLAGGTEILLKQQIGALASEKPLLAVGQSQNKKSAILLGEGLWQWRLQEYADTKSHAATDELIRKLVQYLSAKEDKRKFRVYPLETEVFESEKVVFEAETYNNIYEKIYNQKVDLRVISEAGKVQQFSFVTGENASRFEVGNLPNGIYKYVATTTLGGKIEKSEGEFTVREQQLEKLNTTADFGLLREVARQNAGTFFKANQLGALEDYLKKNQPKGLVHADEQTQELINLRWLFWVLLGLISAEWFLRKWRGSY
ncbi:hypothetical protein SAMN05421780_102361 [Flexibacter flexilis DSM 6793]|uniref:Uncharacterized protein n=2 Tax=Flexibacter flexilis TaxID=998 RepID=A0A1I1FXF1_9BACT|nr:hypothetical protein SAMN05421780_102361 [Flexibacter flexilis DSM 6793]